MHHMPTICIYHAYTMHIAPQLVADAQRHQKALQEAYTALKKAQAAHTLLQKEAEDLKDQCEKARHNFQSKDSTIAKVVMGGGGERERLPEIWPTSTPLPCAALATTLTPPSPSKASKQGSQRRGKGVGRPAAAVGAGAALQDHADRALWHTHAPDPAGGRTGSASGGWGVAQCHPDQHHILSPHRRSSRSLRHPDALGSRPVCLAAPRRARRPQPACLIVATCWQSSSTTQVRIMLGEGGGGC